MEEKDKGGCNPSGRSHAAWENGGGTDACGRRKRYLHKSQRDDEHPVQIHCRDFIRNGRLCCRHLSVFNVFLEKQEYGGRIYRLVKADCCVLDRDHADGMQERQQLGVLCLREQEQFVHWLNDGENIRVFSVKKQDMEQYLEKLEKE